MAWQARLAPYPLKQPYRFCKMEEMLWTLPLQLVLFKLLSNRNPLVLAVIVFAFILKAAVIALSL